MCVCACVSVCVCVSAYVCVCMCKWANGVWAGETETPDCNYSSRAPPSAPAIFALSLFVSLSLSLSHTHTLSQSHTYTFLILKFSPLSPAALKVHFLPSQLQPFLPSSFLSLNSFSHIITVPWFIVQRNWQACITCLSCTAQLCVRFRAHLFLGFFSNKKQNQVLSGFRW